MRSFLLGLAALAGVAAASPAVQAAPLLASLAPAYGDAAVQLVHYYPAQYDEDWRHRQWRRHEEFERYRRHHEWRRERYEEHEHRGW